MILWFDESCSLCVVCLCCVLMFEECGLLSVVTSLCVVFHVLFELWCVVYCLLFALCSVISWLFEV